MGNTNLATAGGVLVWVAMDAWLSKEKKPTFLGAVNGMICGLVGITPCAGFVNGWGAMAVGAICCAIVWFAWNFLSKVRPFSKVDDALGVIYTHGIAGLFGGLLLGIFGDPNTLELGCGHLNKAGQVVNTSQAAFGHASSSCTPFGVGGLMYTGSAHQLWEQFRAAIWVIIWSALVTFILMKLIGLVLGGARYADEILEVGDLAIVGAFARLGPGGSFLVGVLDAHDNVAASAERLADEVVARAEGDHFAVINDGDAIAETLGFFHVVGGVNDRHPFGAEGFDHLEDVVARLRIDTDGGLVHEHDAGAMDETARHVESALHAAGELLHGLVGFVG